MVRAPYFDKNGIKKGAWSKEEDEKLTAYIQKYGQWNWRQLPKFAGLQRCGKSCRIRWLNYLRPDVKRGSYSKAEEDLIIELHEKLGSKWSKIAEQLPGRTDNEIKNHWHTRLKKRERQTQGTPNQELEDQTIESSQIGVIIPDIMEREAENTPTAVNPSHPVILESSPFSPASSSTESPSNSALSNVLFDGDEPHKKRLWSEEEDDKLRDCIQRHGLSRGWPEVPKLAGLLRSSRSCRLRWMNHLQPDVKHGHYTKDEEDLIIKLHEQLGNKWSAIATQLPGRTDNEIKNHWNAHLRKQVDHLDDQPSAISQSLAEASVNKEQFMESRDLVTSTTPSDPILDSFQLTPESSSREFSLFSSDFNMVDAVAPMEWFLEESFIPLETFESDFWTEPYVLDTAGAKCSYPSCSIDW